MGWPGDPPPQPLIVPDLSKPEGAVVGADGSVTCIACGRRLALAEADVVGLGYRCPACSADAELVALRTGTSDLAANLPAHDLAVMRRRGTKLIPGIVTTVAGVCLLPFAVGLYVLCAGGFLLALAYWRIKDSR